MLNDKELKKRYEELKKEFEHLKDRIGGETNYKNYEYRGHKYYIQIAHRDTSAGLRWFWQNKWTFEIVHTTKDGHKNIAPFCLFTSFDDCVLNAVLCEDSLKSKL